MSAVCLTQCGDMSVPTPPDLKEEQKLIFNVCIILIFWHNFWYTKEWYSTILGPINEYVFGLGMNSASEVGKS